jgi:hypothetical protein
VQTKVVIVYSPNVLQRRHVVIPTDDSEVGIHTANLQPGEAAVVGLLSDYHAIGPDAMLAKLFSVPPSNHRSVVVNAFGVVVDVVQMDPAIDQHPHGRLLRDPMGLAQVGQSVAGLGLQQ